MNVLFVVLENNPLTAFCVKLEILEILLYKVSPRFRSRFSENTLCFTFLRTIYPTTLSWTDTWIAKNVEDKGLKAVFWTF